MHRELPLPSLLSQVLIAFTIEFDNAFEHRVPHRTTVGRVAGSRAAGPWLVSLVMWSNFLRHVEADGVSVAEFKRRTGLDNSALRTWLERLSAWWGYLVVGPDKIVRLTAGGRRAGEVWQPLFAEIEARWAARFGATTIAELRAALAAIVGRFGDDALPDYLPILGYGLFAPPPKVGAARDAEADARALDALPLAALLAKALLEFTLEFERDSDLSLAVCANVLRLLDGDGVLLRDLPRLAGVSKEAMAMAVSYLEKRGKVSLEPDATLGRAKRVRLSAAGVKSRQAYLRHLERVEGDWRARFGAAAIEELRAVLERLAGADDATSPLFSGLTPHPGSWRSALAPLERLAHHPMVLHRGGFPDGS